MARKLLSPSRRRYRIDRVRQTLSVSERRVCRTLGQHRSTQRKVPRGRDDENRLTSDVIELARQYGRYGYRGITVMLGDAGWHMNHKRFERIWKREGLKVPPKQPKRARLWLNDGSCVRLRPERPNHVWSYDFVQDRKRPRRREPPECARDRIRMAETLRPMQGLGSREPGPAQRKAKQDAP